MIIIGWVTDSTIMLEDFGRFKGCRGRKLLLLLSVFYIVYVVLRTVGGRFNVVI